MSTRLITLSDVLGVGIDKETQSFFAVNGAITISIIEANNQFRARDDFTLSNLFVRVILNDITSDSVFHSRINGVDGNQLVTFGAGVEGTQEDTTNSDTLTAVGAQLFNADVDVGSGSHGARLLVAMLSFLLEDTDGDVSIIGTNGIVTSLNRNQTVFAALGGRSLTSLTEVDRQYRIRVAPIYDELRIFLSANSIDTDSTFALTDDGTPTSLSATITGDVSGEFEDVTNSATPASGSLVGYRLTIANSGKSADSMTPRLWHVAQESDGRPTMAGATGGSTPSNQNRFLSIAGDPGDDNAVEIVTFTLARTVFTAQNAMVRSSANSCDAQTDIRLRKTGGNSSILMSFAASTSGEQEDTTNTEDYLATDNVNWLVDTIASTAGDKITLQILGFELATTVAVGDQEVLHRPKLTESLLLRQLAA